MDDSFLSSIDGARHSIMPPKSIYYDPVDAAHLQPAIGISVVGLFSGANNSVEEGEKASRIEQLAGCLYVAFMSVFCFLILTTDSGSSFVTGIRGDQVAVVAVSCVVGVSTLFAMMKAARWIIYATCITTPLSLISLSAMSFKWFWWTTRWQYAVLGAVSLVSGLWMIGRLASKRARENVESVVLIMSTACESLFTSLDIFLVPTILVTVFMTLLFVGIHSDAAVGFKVVAILWTFGVCESVIKSVTAMTVSDHYYQKSEEGSALRMLKIIFTDLSLFGRQSLMGLISFLFRLFSMMIIAYRLVVQQTANVPILKTILLSVSSLMTIMERWSMKLSDHCLYTSIATHCTLVHSFRVTVRLFRRNLITALLTDATVNTLMVVIIGAIIMTLSLLFQTRCDLITAMLAFVAVKMYLNIVTACIDTSLVCYALDLDGNEMHKPQLHQAFSHRISVIRNENTAVPA